jgi:hypothetical protein
MSQAAKAREQDRKARARLRVLRHHEHLRAGPAGHHPARRRAVHLRDPDRPRGGGD